MDFITHLWLPILLSGVGVWFISAVGWMVLGHHKKDRDALPAGPSGAGEQEFINTITRLNIPPGNYVFPDFCKHDNLPRDERHKALKALYDTHPQGVLRVWKPSNMGACMLLTFLFYLVTSAVIAYIGWAALPHGSHGASAGVIPGGNGDMFWKVFQVLGTAGVLAYCFSSFPSDIWFQKKRRAMAMDWLDGVVFGLITGAIFAWLWPG